MHGIIRHLTNEKPGGFLWVLNQAVSDAESEEVRVTQLARTAPSHLAWECGDYYSQLQNITDVVKYLREMRAKAELAIGEAEEYRDAWLSEDISEMEPI